MTLFTILAWAANALAFCIAIGACLATLGTVAVILAAEWRWARVGHHLWPIAEFDNRRPNAPDTQEHGAGDGSDGAGITHIGADTR